MSIKSKTVKGSYLANKINLKGFIISNKGGILDREKIINNYSQETIDSCWSALSTNIIQNYQKGKGTIIKGFGVFSFKPREIAFEGSTNQYDKYIRVNEPIFLVSKELNETFCPGEYTAQNGIRYYTQKISKNIPIVKINYAEMAYSISISKDELTNLLKHLFMQINDSIMNKTFKNKLFPGLGELVNKNNIIAMKFDEDFISNINNGTIKASKRNIFLDINNDNSKVELKSKCLTPYKDHHDLIAETSLYTKFEKSGNDYLMNKYRINVGSYPEHIMRTIYNKNKSLQNFKYSNSFKFNNDSQDSSISSNIKIEDDETKDFSLTLLDDETLKSIEYYKGILIKNCKSLDTSGRGMISKSEAIDALVKTNINNKINYHTAKLIVNKHKKTENIEYMKFIAQLIKNSQLALLKKKREYSKTITIETNPNKIRNINYNSFKRENFFNSANNYKNLENITYTNGFFQNNKNKKLLPKKQLSTFRKNYSNKNFKTISITNFNRTTNSFNKRAFSTKSNEDEKGEKAISESSVQSNNKTNIINFYEMQNEIEEIKKYLFQINKLIPTLKAKYFISLDQKINSEELMNILIVYYIKYPKEKIESILKFIGIPDIEAFTLRELEKCIKACKILDSSIEVNEINNIMKKLKDIIYINGGINFFFNNENNPKNTINCETFVKILKDKVPYSPEKLTRLYIYLVKFDREFDKNDFINYFDNPKTKITFDEKYYLNMMKKIIKNISDYQFKVDEYFDYLILKNGKVFDKVITRLNWIKYLQKENLDFTAEELDKLFYWIDTKKDGVIDREEFTNKFNLALKPLTQIKEIIDENKLGIEDLAHYMKINMSDIENYDYETFKQKIRLLSYTYPDDYIKKLYQDLIAKTSDKQNKKTNLLNSKEFLNEINYLKPTEDNKSFVQNYLDLVRERTTFDKLKSVFERYDSESIGTVTRLNYILSLSNILPEYSDEDHIKFIRLTNMFKNYENIKYPEILDLIFFDNKEKSNEPFTKLCLFLINKLKNECNDDVECLMYLITDNTPKILNTAIIHKPLTIEQMINFLNKNDLIIQNKIINKLDIDADGLISIDDLKAVLNRFSLTSFFKYTNDSTSPTIKLYSSEAISNSKFISIIKKLTSYMKMKNINGLGLFKKFDKDNDGFINCVDFNKSIDEILNLSPAIKDQFFNYLDFYHNGLVDSETFTKRIVDYNSGNIIIQNDNKKEIEILEKLKEFIYKNKKLSDTEIFQAMDKDCDGLINIRDFKSFLINNLFIPEVEFNKYQLQRVMMTLSLSKNSQIGLSDLREFINLCNSKDYMNLKEVFKITMNQNLSNLKSNNDWINDVIERFGMYVSEKYDSIEQFFEENTEKGTNKFTFNDFMNFHEKNDELFNNGFNLTKDELILVYTSLDSHKKKFLTLQDLKNKLDVFNFYNKMHIDIRNFMQENFSNGVDAFKYFIKSKNDTDTIKSDYKIDKNKDYITLKEFFDAFENIFPDKYQTNTILKYLNKYFGITLSNNKNDLLNKKDIIYFSEFNYLYFDEFKFDEDFTKEKIKDTKLLTDRDDMYKKVKNNFFQKFQGNNFYFRNLFRKKYELLTTPFDDDPLNKVRRLLCSSKHNLNKFFEIAALECGNDEFIVNKNQFKNVIRQLGIGLTSLEIDQIAFQCGKLTYKNLMNLRDFIRYLYNKNYTLEEGKTNMGPIIGEIKSLIYKFYGSPIICFQNNDKTHSGKIDFDVFKKIIFEMYEKNEAKPPNFNLIKNVYDIIDLRKDGIVDINEWTKTFASYNGTLDVESEKVSNGIEFFDEKFNIKSNFRNVDEIDHNRKVLREWETSEDVAAIYRSISKNRKFIMERIKENKYLLRNNGVEFVHSENLVSILKEIFPHIKISHTQWKMIVNIAHSQKVDKLIDINKFFKLLKITSKNMVSHPLIKK